MSNHRRTTASTRCATTQQDLLTALVRAREQGSPSQIRQAEEAVIVDLLPAAASVARRYRGRGIDFDDLRQVARLGLLKAVRRWRPERGALLPYALPTIEGEVKRYFRDCGSTIRIPRVLYEAQPRVVAATMALQQEYAREPRFAEIAARAGVSEPRVRAVQRAVTACHPRPADSWDQFENLLNPESERDLLSVETRAALQRAFVGLTDRERRIIALRFVWGQSQTQISTAMGVSQMQISRLLRTALDKVRRQVLA